MVSILPRSSSSARSQVRDDRVHVVGDEDDPAPCSRLRSKRLEALALEDRVADGEHLVDQHHVGVDLDHDGERQPDLHAGRVVLQLQIDELPSPANSITSS